VSNADTLRRIFSLMDEKDDSAIRELITPEFSAFLDGARCSERLREAVAILDGALRGATVALDGVHFRLSDATFRPIPTQLPRRTQSQVQQRLGRAQRFGRRGRGATPRASVLAEP
jgi:hypothetical protein